jgi:hypothetical protein
LKIGDFAMIGMGCVVTRDVPAHALVIGNPAHLAGYVCACGPALVRIAQYEKDNEGHLYTCEKCGRVYARAAQGIVEMPGLTKLVKHEAGAVHAHQRV